MPIKKKAKSRKQTQKPVVKEKLEGFFARNKDILPLEAPQKSVRVKTFIVEKPIIIHEKPQHINAGGYEEDEEKYDSKKSKYKKKFRGVELNDDPEPEEEGGGTGVDDLGDETLEGDYLPGDEEALGEEGQTEEDSTDSLEDGIKRKHARSRGMVQNVWWKKALLWAFLVWVLILILELIMQAINLVQVDLTRQWWFLLGGIIVVSFIYFGVFENKLKI